MSEPTGNPPLRTAPLLRSSMPPNNGATYGFFTDQSFATYQPGSSTAQARGVLTTLVPGVGNVGAGVGSVPIVGLVAVLAILWLFERLRIRRRR